MKTLFLFFLTVAVTGVVNAQQPTPVQIIVQAANTVAPVAPAAAKPAADAGPLQSAIKALEQAKAMNAETLKKQEATLQQLDEIQKAAEQLKVFAKRG